MQQKPISSLQVPNESPAFAQYMPELAGLDSGKQTSLVVSTYQLNAPKSEDNKSSSRTGSIFLLSSASTSQQQQPLGLAITHQIPMDGGVFRFEAVDSTTILAALTAGKLAIVDLSIVCGEEQQDKVCTTSSSELSTGMLLNASLCTASQHIVCSDNLGHLMTVNRTTMELAKRWKAHNFKYSQAPCEVWTCCWLEECPQVCISGAEDCRLNLWDLRTSCVGTDCSSPTQTNSNTHRSGITFVKNSCSNNQHLITGSYDEHLRIFDIRSFENPLKEIKLNGGVWHVEEMEQSSYLVAACMYGGWSIVDWAKEICHTNEEQGVNLLYGATVMKTNEDTFKLASCTFNDKCVYEHELRTSD